MRILCLAGGATIFIVAACLYTPLNDIPDVIAAAGSAKIHTLCYGGASNHIPYLDFIASHYDLVIADTPQLITLLKKRNPNLSVFIYKMATDMHPHYPDWDEVNKHESWFVHTKGNAPIKEYRLRGTEYKEYLMDATNKDWQNHFAKQTAIEMLNCSLCDGIFADGCTTYIPVWVGKWYCFIHSEKHVTEGDKGNLIKTNFPIAQRAVGPRWVGPLFIYVSNNQNLDSKNFYDQTTACSFKGTTIKLNPNNLPGNPGTEVWVSYAAIAFPPDDIVTHWQTGMGELIRKSKLVLPDKLLIGNTDSDLYLDRMDGLLLETFIHPPWGKGNAVLTEAQWLEQINLLVHTQKRNKWFIVQSGTDLRESTPQQIEQLRLFCYASFLLGMGTTSTFQFVVETKNYAPNYYPEWDLQIGEPNGPYTVRRIGNTNIYQRLFNHGIVVVNPSDDPAPITVDLDGEYVDYNGRKFRTIIINPKCGNVLLKVK